MVVILYSVLESNPPHVKVGLLSIPVCSTDPNQYYYTG